MLWRLGIIRSTSPFFDIQCELIILLNNWDSPYATHFWPITIFDRPSRGFHRWLKLYHHGKVWFVGLSYTMGGRDTAAKSMTWTSCVYPARKPLNHVSTLCLVPMAPGLSRNAWWLTQSIVSCGFQVMYFTGRPRFSVLSWGMCMSNPPLIKSVINW